MSQSTDLGWVTIPTEEFERLHAEVNHLKQLLIAMTTENERLRAALKRILNETGSPNDWQIANNALAHVLKRHGD